MMRIALRWSLSLGVLAALLWWLEPERIAAELSNIEVAWLLLALFAATLPTLLSAWRWRFTAGRLRLRLPWRTAIGDYYLAGFVNQILPGGVVGDAWRAQRHAQASGRRGPAWRAVIIERASGQLIVVLLALLSVLLYAPWRDALGANLGPLGGTGRHGLALSLPLLLAVIIYATRRRWQSWLKVFGRDIRRALLARRAWPFQLLSSSVIVLSYLLVFALAARGIGLDMPVARLMLLALPVLLAMLIPLSVAGWGFREGAAAGVWLFSGLPPEQGVAASVAYGMLILLASLPGALVLMLRPSARRRAQVQLDQ
ncbi:MAG: lysylphosphatidylglycerol synthase transmembrane domain-containing protein [Wenzhouxiangella sp.]